MVGDGGAVVSRPPYGRTVPGNRWDLLDGLEPDAPPSVSVVVVHFRQPAQLARTLAALERQTHRALEVVVVDDGSLEAPEVPAGVVLLRQEDRGFRAGAARNLGARHARGDVLCFLDADTVPEPDYVACAARLPALAPEAVTIGRRRHADLGALPAGARVEEAAPGVELPAPDWLARGYVESRDLLDADDRTYRFVISAVLTCSRWFFEEVGGFDERFGSYGGEDWEWAARAWRAGGILAHVPGAVAWHDGPDWAGRGAGEPERRVAKNLEAVRLADAIPVAGSRGRGLRGRAADVLVHLPDGAGPAATWVCADAVLAVLPEAVVLVPEEHAASLAADGRVRPAGAEEPPGVRVEVVLERPVRGDGLRDAVDRIAREGLGSLTLTDDDGRTLVRVLARRAQARAARWGTREHFPDRMERGVDVRPIAGEPHVEGWLGGWA